MISKGRLSESSEENFCAVDPLASQHGASIRWTNASSEMVVTLRNLSGMPLSTLFNNAPPGALMNAHKCQQRVARRTNCHKCQQGAVGHRHGSQNLAINQRWSLPCRITLASTTVLHVSTWRSRDTHCPCSSQPLGEGGGEGQMHN